MSYHPSSGPATPGYPDQGSSHHAGSLSLGATPTYVDSGPSSYGSPGGVDDSPLITKREGTVRRGVCKFFNSQKGFGFVLDNNAEELGGQEVFVHFTAIQSRTGFRSLAEGEEVEYEITTGPKGFQATRLTGPGGRPVVGDPKARLVKQPQFMQLAPVAFPGPYGMDPYIQQHPGAVYAASPYTSHVLYMPSNMHPGQQGSYPMGGNGSQFSPPMGSGSFQGSGRGGGLQQGQPGPGQFSATPQGSFGPVGGMASTMGGYQPPSSFQGQPASTYTGAGSSGARYSAALTGGGGPPSNYGRGTPSGGQDDFGGLHSGHGDNSGSGEQPPSSGPGSIFGSGNLLYSTN